MSDVHLGAFSEYENRKLEKDVIDLVSYCKENNLQIVILGDFFDYWMEYGGQPPPLGKNVLHSFESFHKSTGHHTLYITGNHDNWTDGYLSRLGFDIEHEYRIICDGEFRFMVLHGDGLRDPEMDFQRPLMHRFLRNSYYIALYQTLLPPRLGWWFMRMLSGYRKHSEKKKRNRKHRELLDSWARKKVESDDAIRAIVYGHHHHPVLETRNGMTCMNAGFFGKDRTVGLYTNRKFKLVIWDTEKNQFRTKSNKLPNT